MARIATRFLSSATHRPSSGYSGQASPRASSRVHPSLIRSTVILVIPVTPSQREGVEEAQEDFQKMGIAIPFESLVNKFESEVKPINDKVIKNCVQICTLESLRDTLFPKLMSGEIRVQYDKEAQ